MAARWRVTERVLAVVADVSPADGVHASIERTVETFGGIDVLVNNVGLGGGAGLSTPRTSSGRKPSTRRCFRPSARRGSPCRTCSGAAAASS